MKISFWLCLCLVAGGCELLLLPDNDGRLFSFNKDHGPSGLDTVGIGIIVLTWLWMLIQVLYQRKKVYRLLQLKGLLVSLLLIFTGSLLLTSGLIMENNALLWSGTGLAVIGYGILFVAAFRK